MVAESRRRRLAEESGDPGPLFRQGNAKHGAPGHDCAAADADDGAQRGGGLSWLGGRRGRRYAAVLDASGSASGSGGTAVGAELSFGPSVHDGPQVGQFDTTTDLLQHDRRDLLVHRVVLDDQYSPLGASRGLGKSVHGDQHATSPQVDLPKAGARLATRQDDDRVGRSLTWRVRYRTESSPPGNRPAVADRQVPGNFGSRPSGISPSAHSSVCVRIHDTRRALRNKNQ